MQMKPAPICSPHHYLLVHERLPAFVFRMHELILFLLSPEKSRNRILTTLLDAIEGNELRPIPCPFTAEDIRCHEMEIEGKACLILTMPPPSEVTEAYFVAIVCSHSRKELEKHSSDPQPETRSSVNSTSYLTLELGHSFEEDTPATMLCGRTEDARHHVYLAGIKPELNAFIEAVTCHVRARG